MKLAIVAPLILLFFSGYFTTYNGPPPQPKVYFREYTHENATLYGIELSNVTTRITVRYEEPYHITRGGSMMEPVFWVGWMWIVGGLLRLLRVSSKTPT